jgi:hypothetical protein
LVVTVSALLLVPFYATGVLGYFDNLPTQVERALELGAGAVVLAILIWAVVTVVRAIVAVFRPLRPPS